MPSVAARGDAIAWPLLGRDLLAFMRFASAVLPVLGATLLLLGAGCSVEARGTPPAASPPGGRTVCPGSVRVVMTNLTGAVATRLEQLQSTYEGAPGFEAVVFDGRQSIVVVDADALPLWQQHLAGLDLAVAPSCVDKRLTVAVRDLLPALAPRDGIASVGYNGLEDAVEVL